MKDETLLWISMATLIVVCCFSACHASAELYTLNFKNPNTTQAYASLRTPWGTVAAPCAAGADCSVVIDVPLGPQSITAEATSDGTIWSAKSQALSGMIRPPAVKCLASLACRFDFDGDGRVSGTDFTAFVGSFGTSWLPQP